MQSTNKGSTEKDNVCKIVGLLATFRTAWLGLLVTAPLFRLIGTECEVSGSNSGWELFISNESRVILLSESFLTQRTEVEVAQVLGWLLHEDFCDLVFIYKTVQLCV